MLLVLGLSISSTSQAAAIGAGISPPSAEQLEQQAAAELEAVIKDIQTLRRIAYPILQRSEKFCKNVTLPFIGMFFASKYDFSPKLKKAAIKKYGLGEQFKVIQILSGFPAEHQGILVGDILYAIDNIPFSFGENALPSAYKLLHSTLKLRTPSKLTVLRRGRKVALSVTPVNICNFPIILAESPLLYSKATGNSIEVSRVLLGKGSPYPELVPVLTHALAHNVLGHVTASNDNQQDAFNRYAAIAGMSTLFSPTAPSQNAYSQAFELEADFVGLNLMTMGNYGVTQVPQTLRNILKNKQNSLWTIWLNNHPLSAERFDAMEETIAEIQLSRQAGNITFADYKELEKLRKIRGQDTNNLLTNNHDEARVWTDKSFQHLKEQNWPQVIRTSTTAIALDANFDIPYINRALAYIESGSPEKAVEDTNIAISLNATNAKAYNNRGYAYQQLNNNNFAQRDYRKACELGETAGCLNFKSMAGYRPDTLAIDVKKLLDESFEKFSTQQWASVVELSNKILKYDTHNAVAYVNRAGAYAELGQYKQALADCNQALVYDSEYAAAFHNRAYVYELMNNKSEAIRNYQSSCKLGISSSCDEAQRLLGH